MKYPTVMTIKERYAILSGEDKNTELPWITMCAYKCQMYFLPLVPNFTVKYKTKESSSQEQIPKVLSFSGNLNPIAPPSPKNSDLPTFSEYYEHLQYTFNCSECPPEQQVSVFVLQNYHSFHFNKYYFYPTEEKPPTQNSKPTTPSLDQRPNASIQLGQPDIYYLADL